MDPRGWMRRKKSSDKSPGETEESSGSISERLSADEQAHNTQAPAAKDEENEDNLPAAMLKQHAKVAEEAVAGWEKAEREASGLKVQLDAALNKNSALEDRVSHLDGALKECVKRTYEFESRKSELENQLSELHHKLDSAEKENTSMRIELVALHKKLQVTTFERDWSTQTAETASKHRLESIKKVSKLEAECRMLKFATRKASFPNNDHGLSFIASSTCVDSLSDSKSDHGESLQELETDDHKVNEASESKLINNFTELQAKVVYLEDKTKKLEEEKVELEMALDESQGQLRTSEGKLRATKTELRRLQQQLFECQDQLRTSQAKLNGTETELMELQTRLIEHEDQVGASKDLEKVRTQLIEREKQEKELAVAASKFADCQKTIASLGRQLESLAAVDALLLVNDDSYVEASGESPPFLRLPSIDCR